MKSLLALLSLAFVLSVPFANAQDEKAPLATPPAHAAAPLDAHQARKDMDKASRLPDADKADRFNEMLTADYLHFEYAIYSGDEKCAPRETVELDTLKADLEAIDAALFPSIDAEYTTLVTKASADFKKLRDKDESIQTELKN